MSDPCKCELKPIPAETFRAIEAYQAQQTAQPAKDDCICKFILPGLIAIPSCIGLVYLLIRLFRKIRRVYKSWDTDQEIFRMLVKVRRWEKERKEAEERAMAARANCDSPYRGSHFPE